MDCLSEEQMIRMKLSEMTQIFSMRFDIPNRELLVYHAGDSEAIFQRLNALNLDTELISDDTVENEEIGEDAGSQRKLLLWVLAVNLLFFLIELTAGLLSESMGLVSDSLDMLADSLVYGLALFAVGGTVSLKKNIAKAAGYFQLFLAILGLIEVVRRFIGPEELPAFGAMIVVSVFALIANAICLYMLQKSKSRDAHMRASMIFTSNDVVVNLGVIVAGGLVYFTQSAYPDLIVGLIVFLIVAGGAIRILKL